MQLAQGCLRLWPHLRGAADLGHSAAMQDQIYSRAAPLLEAEVDEEIVALDREQGEVFGFNLVASDVWRMLEQPRTLGELCAELEQRYTVSHEECASDVAELLDQLVEMKLVKRAQPA